MLVMDFVEDQSAIFNIKERNAICGRKCSFSISLQKEQQTSRRLTANRELTVRKRKCIAPGDIATKYAGEI
jgi:hypothetical protein